MCSSAYFVKCFTSKHTIFNARSIHIGIKEKKSLFKIYKFKNNCALTVQC